MNFFKKIGIFIYLIVMIGAGASFLVLASGLISAETIGETASLIQGAVEFQGAVAAVGALIILFGLSGAGKAFKKLNKSKLITFQNPDGEVTISLSAIEAYVHRVAKDIPGIKDVKSHVNVSKKGINITSYVSISAGTNIPEATEVIQMTVKSKVQDMLGIAENINIKMHINKILKGPEVTPAPEDYQEPQEEDDDSQIEANVPYRG